MRARAFHEIETLSGLLLLVAAIVAVAWANSPWRAAYEGLWTFPVGVPGFTRDLRFWINDGLMAIFFFVVGLEIRRELAVGQLADRMRAALPAAAALGGMVVPAALFLLVNGGTASARGWGIPMATDIAFAVGVMGLLGRRVRPAVRVLLLALAVIDDLGAIVVIALFYSTGINLFGGVLVGAGLLLLLALRRWALRSPWAFLPPGLLLWIGVSVMGVHPTMAGVALGLLAPGARARAAAGDGASTSASPADRLERALHPWVAFAVMPLFALANAGVSFVEGRVDLDHPAGGWRVLSGVVVGLVLGKPIGILGFSYLVVRLRLARLPDGVRWPEMAVLGVVAGIGFTMALFIAALAFPAGPSLAMAKLGIVAASTLAAAAGLALGRRCLPGRLGEGGQPPDDLRGSV